MAALSFYVQQHECFAALQQGQVFSNSLYLDASTTQASGLIPFLQNTWQQVGNPSLKTIIAPRGPGSFTSLRVTLAAAQGLAMAFPEATIFAPTNFEVLAYTARKYTAEDILVLVDSKKEELYSQIYKKDGTQEAPKMITKPEIDNFLHEKPSLKIIADFHLPDDWEIKSRLIQHNDNLAVRQLEFFLSCKDLQEQLDYQSFTPYYLHLPQYAKRKSLSACSPSA